MVRTVGSTRSIRHGLRSRGQPSSPQGQVGPKPQLGPNPLDPNFAKNPLDTKMAIEPVGPIFGHGLWQPPEATRPAKQALPST
ncbi:hypothetical protein O181_066272 [Austropuccinia psidii MF-1]|uniref:Uncharacterized protein n=1 Tax=Austropuccinia psidii MF-1 TaxID=1389203 RepID=A0A9Q3I449_9BASI|nr:hypothetical protein [Austropuccinia psidii MF-1]